MGGRGKGEGIRRREKVTKGDFAIRTVSSTLLFAPWNIYRVTNRV